MVTLVLEKAIQTPPDKSTPIALQPRYTQTSFQTSLIFKAR